MAFNSPSYAVLFIALAFVYFLTPQRLKRILLLGASYYFYACYSPDGLWVLILTTLIAYSAGLLMGRKSLPSERRPYLIVSVALCLSSLIIFKYLNFLAGSLRGLSDYLGVLRGLPELRYALPLGISFYTLGILSYLIDIKRGRIEAEKNIFNLALYVGFFPNIVSGPIERGWHFLPQFKRRIDFSLDRTLSGIKQIIWGLFKKLIIADRLSVYVNQVYDNPYGYRGTPLIIATLFFGIQLYCDFSGYTDMAIGCARILGYDLMKNFNLPYFSRDTKEFWKRWHISLSSWFMEYLYFPLGGSRVSRWRNYFNLFTVFFVSGLWHGAAWTFGIWGGLHGLYSIVGKASKSLRSSWIRRLGLNQESLVLRLISIAITFLLVDFAWLFFRANTIRDAIYISSNLLNFSGPSAGSIINLNQGIVLGFSMFLLFLRELVLYRNETGPYRFEPLFYTFLMVMILVFGKINSSQFIYFKF